LSRLRLSVFSLLAVLASFIAIPPSALSIPSVQPITITVNSLLNTADPTPGDGVCNVTSHVTTCTLRAAIQTANAHAETSGRDLIKFSIPGGGPKTISVTSTLPAITDATVLDGSTQPATSGTDPCSVQLAHPCIELAGPGGGTGLQVDVGPTTIRGLVVNRFVEGLVLGDDEGGDRVEGSYVGTNAQGTAALANTDFGIVVGAPGAVIGGDTPAAGNLVSGNGADGIEMADDSALVENNLIGTNAAGTAAIPNGDAGIDTQLNPTGVTIGAAGAGNVISGNGGPGIRAFWSDSVISANLIGTDITGESAIPNGQNGILVAFADGLTIGGTVEGAGNLISGHSNAGIQVKATSGSLLQDITIVGNHIGTNLEGTAAIANGLGIELVSPSTGVVIGGSTAGSGNLISGNAASGVLVRPDVDGAFIQGNLIGTDASGTAALGNTGSGISLLGTHAVVGGATAGARNVISGQTFNTGISTQRATGTGGNVIRGNYIGTDVTGEVAIPNANGISLAAGRDVVGGGSGAGNVISGNTNLGVELASGGNRLLGNRIGLSVSGQPLGNGSDGVSITGTGTGTKIGGSKSAVANRIASNGGNGVSVEGGTNGVRILRNSIHDNDDLGIDLVASGNAADGVTPNDGGDADTGGNGLQNFHVVTAAIQKPGSDSTRIKGRLSTTPGAKFSLRFYSNTSCDPSGFGEGGAFLKRISVTTDVAGVGTFSFLLGTSLALGRQVTATATAANGDTSELSRCRAVTAS
jgi:CSLREA domain-containing protein